MRENAVLLTDKELCERWSVSLMTIHRMRQDGRLPPPFKPSGKPTGHNRTPLSVVRALEAAAATPEPVEA
jgi:predicted site-specific integrase-resolvase